MKAGVKLLIKKESFLILETAFPINQWAEEGIPQF